MHRDIKAGNILPGADGGVKLVTLCVGYPSFRHFVFLVCTNWPTISTSLPAPFLHSIQVCRPRSPITRSADGDRTPLWMSPELIESARRHAHRHLVPRHHRD